MRLFGKFILRRSEIVFVFHAAAAELDAFLLPEISELLHEDKRAVRVDRYNEGRTVGMHIMILPGGSVGECVIVQPVFPIGVFEKCPGGECF